MPVEQRGPGWYPDPKDPSRSRWWTGRDWSSRTEPNTGSESTAQSASRANQPPPPSPRTPPQGASAWNQPIPLDLDGAAVPATAPSASAGAGAIAYGASVTLPVAVVDAFRRMFNWSGRTTRSGFWWVWLVSFALNVVSTVWDNYVLSTYPGYNNLPLFDPSIPALVDIISLLFLPVGLAISIMILGSAVRRVHDVGRSGWFILVPFYNVYLCLKSGDPGPNRWG